MDGKKALAIREKLGIAQGAFWALFGVTQSGGSRYEQGRKMPKQVALLVGAASLQHEATTLTNRLGLINEALRAPSTERDAFVKKIRALV